jgi:hypothetical protein
VSPVDTFRLNWATEASDLDRVKKANRQVNGSVERGNRVQERGQEDVVAMVTTGFTVGSEEPGANTLQSNDRNVCVCSAVGSS